MSAQAQKANEEVKVATVTMGIENINYQEVSLNNDNSVARLYMFKNSRIKKELSFATKLNKAKLA
jgi:hypothetical protein